MLLLHGNNLVSSRRELENIIKNFQDEVVFLNASQINLTKLKQTLESQSLFKSSKLIVIENLFSLRSKKILREIVSYLKNTPPKNLIIWENKTINEKLLSSFKDIEIKTYNLPPIIFKFLDSLSPYNKKYTLSLLHQCLKKEKPEIILYWLCQHIQNLIIAIDFGAEELKVPEWKKTKLLTQAKIFGLEKLTKIYQKLLEIEYQQKIGKAILSLASQLDLLIFTL